LKVTDTEIPDVKIIEPTVYEDERGFFFESFNQKKFEKAIGYKVNFVQDNHSKSLKGVLRGLHYQLPPYAQGKLVRVIQGKVFDVAVDLRRNSLTFGRWVGKILSADNKNQLWVPAGFGHGFLVKSDIAEVEYKVDAYWSGQHERSLMWNDSDVSIDWPRVPCLKLSNKDQHATSLRELIELGDLFDESHLPDSYDIKKQPSN